MEKVLITGASSGIGLQLARQFASHGHPLFLTARNESELLSVARDLEAAHGVSVTIMARDLAQPESAQEIYAAASAESKPVEILVNNAGSGQLGEFSKVPMESLISMIRLNVEAVVRLTRLFLPAMVANRRGKILNTASVAAFEPGPMLAAYHATKAFVLSLSESLVEELKSTGVTVTALCPGVTDTDFISKAGMIETKLFQTRNVMAPQEVAAQGFEALMRGDRLCVVGGENKAVVFARRLLTTSAQAKLLRKMYEPAPAKQQKRHRGEFEAAGSFK